MVKRCCYGICNSDSRYSDRPYMTGISFIPFPKPWENLEKCKRWVHLCGRKNFTFLNVTKDTYICSKHFIGATGPTDDFPDPISAIGDGKPRLIRRKVVRGEPVIAAEPVKSKKRKFLNTDEPVQTEESSVALLTSEPLLKDVGTQTEPERDTRDAGTQTLGEKYMKILVQRRVEEAEKIMHDSGSFFSYKNLETSVHFKFWTGVTVEHLNLILDVVGREKCETLKYHAKQSTPMKKRCVRKLSVEDRLLIVLIRLRRGFTEKELALFFEVAQSTISKTVRTWIQFLYLEFKKFESCMVNIRKEEKVPFCFRRYKNLKLILDCTEIRIETPTDFTKQGNTYSSYKSSNTIKFLIGINVYGGIAYVSEGFEGAISDREIFAKSGIMELLKPNDCIMADRGFNIQDILNKSKIKLIIPPFLKGRPALTAQEEISTKAIARSRVHVERAIGRIKNYRIFKNVLKFKLAPFASQMFFVASYLVNFEAPFVS